MKFKAGDIIKNIDTHSYRFIIKTYIGGDKEKMYQYYNLDNPYQKYNQYQDVIDRNYKKANG